MARVFAPETVLPPHRGDVPGVRVPDLAEGERGALGSPMSPQILLSHPQSCIAQ